MTHPFQLRYDPASNAALRAWFLPGDSAARWLDELVRSGLAVMETRLYPVPRSLEDRTVVGLLVVPPSTGSGSTPPAGIACRLVGERLFMPVDASLHPPMADAELRKLFVLPVSFYHPVFGLSGFEEEAVLRVNDLLQLPEEHAANWNFARPGPSALPELSGVVLLEPPSLENIFGGAEDDIGSEPLVDLPPAPGEPSENMAADSARKLRKAFAKRMADALRRLPRTAAQRNWLNNAEDWANRQLRGVDKELEQLRNKEINRLLHLLDADPEEGLRRAISLNNFAHRGTTPPSSRLGSRSLNFDPSRLGGRPADFWNVPSQLQEVLRRRYREMADREMQLGRHRRAAYIYAELLGDLVSAANALKRGKLYREAALVYEDHLKNPLEAARCLAEGGLLAEAIQRYEKLEHWLEVADLHERAGNPAAAAEAIRRVVNERLTRGDILGAAKMVEERLHEPDEALEMLLRAWPLSFQAATSVGAVFQLLARLGRHETALDRLAQFSREPVPNTLAQPLASALSVTARVYPDERVRHRAADFSRVLIAQQLQQQGLTTDNTQRLLECLVSMAPQDRLLSRDTNRYLASRREAELRKHRITPSPAPGNKPVVHRTFELPRQMQWLHLRREWHWFYALGVTAKRLTLVRGVWSGGYQSLAWDCPGMVAKHTFIFEPTAEHGKAIAIAMPGWSPFSQKHFPAADEFFKRECAAGTPAWLPMEVHPLAIGEDAAWTAHMANNRMILSCYDKTRGQLLRTIDVTDNLCSNATRTEESQLSLAVLSNGVVVALGNRLVVTNGDGTQTRVELPGQAVGLVATIPNTRQGVAVMLNQGAIMYWIGARGCIELDRDIRAPMGAFVPGGPLVLASGLRLMLFDVSSQRVHSVTRLELSGQRAAGISSTASPGEFAVLGERGEVTVFRMPR